MDVRDLVYRSALRAARPLLAAAAPLNEKLGRGVRARRTAVPHLMEWASRARDPQKPLVWMHAPSVGEALMAQAIISALRRKHPGVQIAFTFFSPSTERVAASVGADVAGYLPWDLPGDTGAALDALDPAAIVFVRTEVWPVLARLARDRGARLLLVNAVLPAQSSRLRAPARALLRSTYTLLDKVGAVTPEHANRFRLLGVPRSRVRVTGDARFDQVWARVHGLPSADVRFLERLRDATSCTLVAGSTWSPDERVLVEALAALRGRAAWRVIFAPHEPTSRHLANLEKRLAAAGIRHARLSDVEEAGHELPAAIVVDRLGILADLYGAGEAAYVGGGFHRAGIHSVVEPAALAVPVLFGPRHLNAREADELQRVGGGFVIPNAAALARRLEEWSRATPMRRIAGEAALAYVRGQLGGAQANAELIADLL